MNVFSYFTKNRFDSTIWQVAEKWDCEAFPLSWVLPSP